MKKPAQKADHLREQNLVRLIAEVSDRELAAIAGAAADRCRNRGQHGAAEAFERAQARLESVDPYQALAKSATR